MGTLIFRYIKPSRIRLTADHGFADDRLFVLLQQLRVSFVIRVKGCVKVCWRRHWQKLNRFGFHGNQRHQTLGHLLYCQKSPRRLWVHQSRARSKTGRLEVWSLVSNFARTALKASTEYARRFSCEEGFRDAKWYLGWFFGNRCPGYPYLVAALCECSASFQIKANAAEEVANVAQAVTASFEHLDFVIEAFDPTA